MIWDKLKVTEGRSICSSTEERVADDDSGDKEINLDPQLGVLHRGPGNPVYVLKTTMVFICSISILKMIFVYQNYISNMSSILSRKDRAIINSTHSVTLFLPNNMPLLQ